VTLQVFEVDVEDDNAFAGVASVSPIPVRVVTAVSLGQSQRGSEVIDCSGLSVKVGEDSGLLAFFRGKCIVVARYGFGALLPSETTAYIGWALDNTGYQGPRLSSRGAYRDDSSFWADAMHRPGSDNVI